MLTAIQLRIMLDLQNKMNSTVNPEWATAGFAWTRAIMMEATEAIEHHNSWKWWKKNSPDMTQTKMELIDIWHFFLSRALIENDRSDSKTADAILKEAGRDGGIIMFDGSACDTENMNLVEKLELMAGLAAAKRFEVCLFMEILNDCEMSTDELYLQYISKNVLNITRQMLGYKEGTYKKIWNGREDNEHLVEIMNGLDIESESFADDVKAGLLKRYPDQEAVLAI